MTTTDTAVTTEITPDTEPTEYLLSEIDLYLLAKPIAKALGDGWSEEDDETNVGVDKAIRLHHTDGRAIGVRHLWRGQAVQTFAIGGPSSDSASNGLPPGTRYSTGVRFTTDAPLDEIITAIRTVLLPAFTGHRPPLSANGTRIQPTPAGNEQPTATTAPSPTPQDAKTASAPAKAKSTTRQSATSAQRKTKSPAKHKPRRKPAAAAA